MKPHIQTVTLCIIPLPQLLLPILSTLLAHVLTGIHPLSDQYFLLIHVKQNLISIHPHQAWLACQLHFHRQWSQRYYWFPTSLPQSRLFHTANYRNTKQLTTPTGQVHDRGDTSHAHSCASCNMAHTLPRAFSLRRTGSWPSHVRCASSVDTIGHIEDNT